jgi:hypothetical protein
VAGVIVQPGASTGHETYCPISGVVFQVKEASATRTAAEKPLFFCCEACAKNYEENLEKVSLARGLPR